jgi:hypothetical protein
MGHHLLHSRQMELHVKGATARGTPKEIAEFADELHRRGVLTDVKLVSTHQQHLPAPGEQGVAESKVHDSDPTLATRIVNIPTKDVIAFVKTNPKADVEALTRQFLGIGISWVDGHDAYHKAYNKLAHARKMLGLPAPTPRGPARS